MFDPDLGSSGLDDDADDCDDLRSRFSMPRRFSGGKFGPTPARTVVIAGRDDSGADQTADDPYGPGSVSCSSSSKLTSFRRTCNTCMTMCMEHPHAPRYWLLFLVAAMGMALGIHIANSDATPNNYDAPSESSKTLGGESDKVSARRDAIYKRLSSISGEDALKDPTSDQFWALHWITDRDEMRMGAKSPYLEQRYALAVLYYALGLDLHFADGGGGGERWLDAQWECQWAGVRCDARSYVNEIRLVNMQVKGSSALPGLSGTIPNEIASLSALEILDLRNNQITGTVPDSVGDLVHLNQLYLDNNLLTGMIAASSDLCSLVDADTLKQFTTDCDGADAEVECFCCSNCPQLKDVGADNDDGSTQDLAGLDANTNSDANTDDGDECTEGGGSCLKRSDCCSERCWGDGYCGYV